jgi:hypothetical protein
MLPRHTHAGECQFAYGHPGGGGRHTVNQQKHDCVNLANRLGTAPVHGVHNHAAALPKGQGVGRVGNEVEQPGLAGCSHALLDSGATGLSNMLRELGLQSWRSAKCLYDSYMLQRLGCNVGSGCHAP